MGMGSVPYEAGFRVSVSQDEGRQLVTALGELDLASADAFGALLREHLAEGPVLLDLSALAFMDSSGVRELDAVLGDADRAGWTLAVRPELHENVRQILRMTGLIDHLPLAPADGAQER